jgi:hypothetical protein
LKNLLSKRKRKELANVAIKRIGIRVVKLSLLSNLRLRSKRSQ